MAKKKQMLPDLTKQDILTPLDISQLGSNGDPCFGIGYDYPLKNVNYAEIQNCVHSRCPRT